MVLAHAVFHNVEPDSSKDDFEGDEAASTSPPDKEPLTGLAHGIAQLADNVA